MGTAGEIVKIMYGGDRRVRFPRVVGVIKPENLVLATLEQEAELGETKAAHAAAMVVGAVVIWIEGADNDIPEGTAGEIVEIVDDGRGDARRARFPTDVRTFVAGQLCLATPEQAERWAVIKAGQDSERAAELPLVRKIFSLFDADMDGKINKVEMQCYLKGIGAYTDAKLNTYKNRSWDTPDGITQEGFETILYGNRWRGGKAQEDLDKCQKWTAMSEDEQTSHTDKACLRLCTMDKWSSCDKCEEIIRIGASIMKCERFDYNFCQTDLCETKAFLREKGLWRYGEPAGALQTAIVILRWGEARGRRTYWLHKVLPVVVVFATLAAVIVWSMCDSDPDSEPGVQFRTWGRILIGLSVASLIRIIIQPPTSTWQDLLRDADDQDLRVIGRTEDEQSRVRDAVAALVAAARPSHPALHFPRGYPEGWLVDNVREGRKPAVALLTTIVILWAVAAGLFLLVRGTNGFYGAIGGSELWKLKGCGCLYSYPDSLVRERGLGFGKPTISCDCNYTTGVALLPLPAHELDPNDGWRTTADTIDYCYAACERKRTCVASVYYYGSNPVNSTNTTSSDWPNCWLHANTTITTEHVIGATTCQPPPKTNRTASGFLEDFFSGSALWVRLGPFIYQTALLVFATCSGFGGMLAARAFFDPRGAAADHNSAEGVRKDWERDRKTQLRRSNSDSSPIHDESDGSSEDDAVPHGSTGTACLSQIRGMRLRACGGCGTRRVRASTTAQTRTMVAWTLQGLPTTGLSMLL